RIDHVLGEGIHRKEGAQVLDGLALAAGDEAALAELEDEIAAIGALVELLRERPHHAVLVAEREARLALVGRDHVEALEDAGGEVAKHPALLLDRADLVDELRLDAVGDGAVVEGVDLQQAVAAADD